MYVPHGSGCSTPVGVIDRFTTASSTAPPSTICAQRLSASSIGSPKQTSGYELSYGGCSTPVGVIDRFTRMRGTQSTLTSKSAQRLSASSIGSQLQRGQDP